MSALVDQAEVVALWHRIEARRVLNRDSAAFARLSVVAPMCFEPRDTPRVLGLLERETMRDVALELDERLT